MTTKNTTAALQFWEAINTRQFDRLETLLSRSLVSEKGKTRETILNDLRMFSGGFSDLHFHIDHTFCEGQEVAVRWTMTGTHTAPFGPYKEATGNKVDHQGISLFKVEDGKITEFWPGSDRLRVSQQLGDVPK